MTDTTPQPTPPSRDELPWVLEALLLASEEPIGPAALARVTGVGERSIRAGLERLAGDYEARGLRLQEEAGRYQLVTAPEYAPYVSRLLGDDSAVNLSRAALETLTIIAYRQPCTRGEVEAIRGVNSDRIVASLEQRELIENVGTARSPGRPKLYRPATRFYEHFGLLGPSDLPPLPEDDPSETVDI
ncbi:MAG: SMC-Scp complex subunit ScpB [Dehalococcoidia bacterium]|nr:SMC-Scp complex subunit ScpB [Dehalococcoidia bacterium]